MESDNIPDFFAESFVNFKLFWQHSFDFKTATKRSQYWTVLLWNYFILFVFYGLAFALPNFYHSVLISLSIIYSCLIIIPGISIVCRRYVDTGKPYWYGLFWEFSRACLRIIYGLIVLNHLHLLQNVIQLDLPSNMNLNIIFNELISGSSIVNILILIAIVFLDIWNMKYLCKPTISKFQSFVASNYK